MPRNLMVGVLILASLTACTTLPKPSPIAEARLQEANPALDSLSTATSAFYANVEPLLQDIKALHGHPGWSDMEAIIAVTRPDDDIEDNFPADQGLQKALDDWSAKWGESGEDLFLYYRSLVDRCSISEARRIGVIGRIVSLQSLYLEVIFLELADNRYSQAEAIYGTVETLSKAENELNSFTLNSSGLYDVKPAR
jgi:hypothetical protein